MFPDENRVAVASLATSWIPGRDGKGTLRYRVAINAKDSDTIVAAYDEEVETFLNRIDKCIVRLRLLDTGGFLLKDQILDFVRGQNDRMRLRSLISNDALPMSLEEYKMLVGNAHGKSGSWELGWACSPAGKR